MITKIKDANVPSWKTAEKCGFKLMETRMYKDIDDEKEKLYRFYVVKKIVGKIYWKLKRKSHCIFVQLLKRLDK